MPKHILIVIFIALAVEGYSQKKIAAFNGILTDIKKLL